MASRLVHMSYLSTNSSLRRSCSMETYMVRVYVGALTHSAEFISVEALKNTRADEIASVAVGKLKLGNPDLYELAETFSSGGQLCKERRLEPVENPVRIQLLWPRVVHLAGDAHRTEYHFYLRRKEADRKVGSWVEFAEPNPIESFLSAFLTQPKNKEYPDLCNLPDLNETTLLQNLASRFHNGNIYTYVGSILISVNPFKFYPIYNPKYVKMYQNRRLGDLPPHIFAIADAAYHTMLQEKRNQCIVISGESGSGKTESTNLLLHHLSALSQRAVHGTGVEQTILGAGPVLEAFGNAKTVHNNNSSRFGKFIQVNYKENGMVHGAIVEKYLLEKSRIVSQAQNERNYHVFYYLLAGATDGEKEALCLTHPNDYFYLNQSQCYTLEGIDGEYVDEAHEFTRLKQSMEMVGFCTELQRRIFSVLAAVLHLGNIEFRRKADHQHHEAVSIKNPATVKVISSLLKVKESTLVEALTKKKTTAGGETVVMSYNLADAVQTRDAMAKCLYGGLFDWIVLQVNHALLSKQEMKEHQGNYIGVLDIFGFEDFGQNSFEQFCINYANERLHYYFNQHIFKFEQEEYVREGIQWKNIEFIDNTQCLDLFAKKPTGLLYLLDEECNFPGATNNTLLDKFHAQHQNNPSYEVPQMKESAFSIIHYAGKVKYHIQDFREKNSDLIRQDIMLVLKNSSLAFVRELVEPRRTPLHKLCYDPVAVLRWAIIRAFFRAYFAFIDAGKRHRRTCGTGASGATSWNKFGAILRQQSQPQRPQQHMSLPPGDMSSYRKVVIVEKQPHSNRRNHRHVSYHGDISRHLENGMAVGGVGDDDEEEEGRWLWEREVRGGGVGSGVAMHEAEEAWASGEGLVNDSRAMRRASRVLMKSKSFKPRARPAKTFRDLKSMKTLAGKTVLGPRSSKSKNKSPSVSAQFSHSLTKLMETLNQANPFFIRCIKSNADKAPCNFDEEIVVRQLRYTGMLATVKIRQSGYNYRLTFDEFIHQYKILLPKGLVSSKDDVRHFLEHLDLNTENYQIGKTKVFLREAEKLLLDDALHQAIMKHIVHIQRWARTRLERQRFVRMRTASIIIQAQVRSFLAQRKLHRLRLQFYATLLIQKAFRGFRERKQLRQQRVAAVQIQKVVRGYLARRQYKIMRDEREREQLQQKLLHRQQEERQQEELLQQEALLKAKLVPTQDEIPLVEKERVRDECCHLSEQASISMPGEVFHGAPCVSPPEDGKVGGETVDLHSSASDEGILTKESSTEELIDRELDLSHHTHGHDSEESSGILDDSEPDNISLETPRTKSRGSSYNTPPSTPHSPQPFGHDTIDGRTAPLPLPGLARQVPPLHPVDRFELVPRMRTQAGPRDLEICIRPAIQKSASEEAFPCSGDVVSGVAWREKRISAPLAKQESMADQPDHDGHIRKVIVMDQPPRQDSDKKDKDLGDPSVLSLTAPTGPSSHRSPFHRAKRHIKNIMGGRKNSNKKDSGEDSDNSETEESPLSPVGKFESQKKNGMPLRKSGKDSLQAEEPRNKRKHRRKGSNKKRAEEEKKTEHMWSVSSTSQWQYPADFLVRGAVELQQLDRFVCTKINELSKDCGRRDTVFDVVFKGALKEFYSNLITHTSVAYNKNNVEFRYRDLMLNFEETLKARAQEQELDADFPVTIGINAFRGFLDEFNRKKENKELPKMEVKKEKKKKEKEQYYEHLGHKFVLIQFSIPTYCEYCSSLMWMVEKGNVCTACKYTVHKKCCNRSLIRCRGYYGDSQHGSTNRVIGSTAEGLLVGDQKVPLICELLLSAIELNGLYTVGLYRKAGAAGKVKQLISLINENRTGQGIDFSEFPIHVLTSVMKTFFREMPEPLLTYDLYYDFIRGGEISDEKERMQCLYAIIDKLPTANHDLLERLIFHLANVAQHEGDNKMSANSLAIIFAPSVLRSPRSLPAQESLQHVPKQTMCIQSIIREQMRKIRHTLADIKTLDTASASASDRLNAVRASMRTNGTKAEDTESEGASSTAPSEESDTQRSEELILSEQIRSLQEEKDMLTLRMPALECRHSSSEEDILSTDDLDSTGDELDEVDENYEEYAVTFDLPAVSPPKNLRHLNKNRVQTPTRRLPSQKQRSTAVEEEGNGGGAEKTLNRAASSTPQLKQVGEEIIV